MTRKISALIEKQRAEKERKREGILRLRLEYRMTYDEIGQALGISRERVRQLIGPERVKRPGHQPQNRKPTEGEKFYKRFWANIDIRGKDECWSWKLKKTWGRYGRIRHNGSLMYVHRVMYQIKSGEEIPAGRVVMHTCDNPWCVNPNHLLLGTQLDNIRDRDNKGRHRAPEVIRELARKRDIELADFIAKYFGGKPVTIAQLVEATGGSRQGMYAKVRRMERRGLIHYERNSRGGRTPGLVYARSVTP